MSFLINIITMVGTVVWWIIQKFFPFIIKKFGLSTVKLAIQKSISALLVLMSAAFYTSVIIFISQTYTVYRNLLVILNNPSSQISGGAASSYFSCFLSLLHTSGIAAGFNAAFSFGLSVLVFFMLRGLYSITQKTLKIISDEVAKSLKLV